MVAKAETALVSARVLPKGAGKVCTGDTTAVFDEETQAWAVPTHKRGDVFKLDGAIAKELEDRGFVEIQA